MADLMISYAREDAEFVRDLQQALADHQVSTWIDTSDLLPAAPVRQEIFDAIAGATGVVLVLTPAWVDSAYCRLEFDHALYLRKRLIPLALLPVDASRVPPQLADVNWVRFDQRPPSEALGDLLRAFSLDIERVRKHARLLQRAQQWEGRRDPSHLLRGLELDEAERWLDATPGDPHSQPTPLHVRFILESRRAETSRQRARLVAVSVALVITVALGLATYGFYRSAEARRRTAHSRLLASESDARRPGDIALALLLASHAYATDPTVEARGSLLRHLTEFERLRHVLHGGSGGIEGLAMGGAEPFIAAGDSGGRLLVWRVADGIPVSDPVAANDSGEIVNAVAISPSDGFVTAGSMDGELRTWKVSAGRVEQQWTRKHAVPIQSVAYSPDGALLAVGDLLGTVTVFDVRHLSEDPIAFTNDHDAPATALAFSHTSSRLAIGRGDQYVSIHDLGARDAAPIRLAQRAPIAGLAFTPDDAALVSAGGEQFSVWRVSDPRGPLRQRHTAARVLSFVLTTDGTHIIAGLNNGEAHLLPLAGEAPPLVLPGHGAGVRSAAIAGGVFAAGGGDGRVLAWSIDGPSPLVTRMAVHGSDPTDLAFDAEGLTVASVDLGSTLALWDGADGHVSIERLDETLDGIDRVAFLSGGRLLALVSQESGVVFWATDTRARRGDVVPLKALAGVAFGAEGGMVGLTLSGSAVVTDGSMRELKSCAPVTPLSRVLATAFRGDARRLALGTNDGTLATIDLDACVYRTGARKEASGGVVGVSFLDADRLVAATETGELVVWDPRQAEAPTMIPTGNTRLLSFAHSAPAALVAIGDADGQVDLWDTRFWQRVGPPLHAHDGFVLALAFNPEGTRLASSGADGTIDVWNVDPAAWAARACRMASRPFDDPERLLFDIRDTRPCGTSGAGTGPWSEPKLPPGLRPVPRRELEDRPIV